MKKGQTFLAKLSTLELFSLFLSLTHGAVLCQQQNIKKLYILYIINLLSANFFITADY